MKKLLFLSIVLSLSMPQLVAQTLLPHTFAPGELRIFVNENSPSSPFSITNPPTFPVRTMAEWEEVQALLVSWRSYPAVLTEIVRNARLECEVIILCNSASVRTTAINYLLNNGVDTTGVTFLIAGNDSVWIRDYGPENIYANDVDSLYLLDWVYNRPSRVLDDASPSAVGAYMGLEVYETAVSPWRLVHTGGNFMSDGMGTGFSSELVHSENASISAGQVDQIMDAFMGIDRYIKMETLPYDVIHHIDMHMKLLDEETLLVGQYPAGVADGPQIEANLQYVLNNYLSPFGTPYKVVRIPMPPQNNAYPNTGADYRTYANAIFINKTILVPFYEERYDTTAQRIWETAMPGYNVVGIPCNDIIQALGAIHCITKGVGVNDPLLIVHDDLEDTYDQVNPYLAEASIKHRSGISSATLYYRTSSTAAFTPLAMTAGMNNTWSANIPAQIAGTSVEYYIEGNANSGKTQVRPITAPAGYWQFDVLSNPSSTNNLAAGIEHFDVFPNPAHGLTCVPVHSGQNTAVSLYVCDMLGQKVLDIYAGELSVGEQQFFFQSEALPSGSYLLVLASGEERLVRKLVVR